MFSGIVNPYSTISPEFKYPRKYYLIQELTGNSIDFYHTTSPGNISNIFSNINPVANEYVPLNHGVINFEANGRTLIINTKSSTLRNKTIEYFINTPNLTTNTAANTHFVLTDTAGAVLFRMQPSCESSNGIRLTYKNNTASAASTTALTSVYISTSSTFNWITSGWNHIAFSSNSEGRFKVFLNGNRVLTNNQNSRINNFSTDMQLRLSCNSSPVYYSDIRITNNNMYYSQDVDTITVPRCPLQPVRNTIILLTGNFDPTRFRKNVVATTTVFQDHPTGYNGSGVFTGWVEVRPTNTTSLTTSSSATGQKVGLVVGNDGTSRQFVSEATTTSTVSNTFSAQGNSFAPCYLYITGGSGSTCSLNGININLTRFSNAQLANSFMICDDGGRILKNTTPRTFTDQGGFDNLMLRPSNAAKTVAVSNLLAGNIYLVDQQNRFIGYTGGQFTITTPFEWNFVPLGENRFRTAAGNVFIFLK